MSYSGDREVFTDSTNTASLGPGVTDIGRPCPGNYTTSLSAIHTYLAISL